MSQGAGEHRSESILAHRYRLERQLGQGSAGEVFVAFDFLRRERVALKLLRSEAAGAQLEAALRDEFRVLRALQHPAVVRVHEFGHTGSGVPFFTMELLAGEDLAASSHGVDPHALLEQAASALDLVHSQGLVHSDLKPANVFRVGDRYVLTDFGLVRRLRSTPRAAPYGTLAYMPPERLRGATGPPHPREDLYALGAVLFELLAGRPPFAAETPAATRARIQAGDLDSELRDVPSGWGRLLRRLLAADPAARYASAWELRVGWCEQFGRPAPEPTLQGLPFVGRRRELLRIRDALGLLGRGRGASVHVHGAPGSGKSAFLDAVERFADASGLPSWRWSGGTVGAANAASGAFAAWYGDWGPALPSELHEAARAIAAWPAAAAASGAADAQVLRASVLAAMERIATVVPHLLLIDDGSTLDAALAELLAQLPLERPGAAILVCITETSRAGNTGGVAAPDGAPPDIMLRELGAEDVGTLVRRSFGTEVASDALATRLHAVTGGHPLLVVETLRHLVASGRVRRSARGWEVPADLPSTLAPRAAGAIVEELLDDAGPEAREIVAAVALCATPTSPSTLQHVLQRPAASIEAALAHGVRNGLLVAETPPADPAGGGHALASYRFAQEMLREAAATLVPESRQRELHARIASARAGTPEEALHRWLAGERRLASASCYCAAARHHDTQRASPLALRYYEAALESDPEGADAEALLLRIAALRIQLGRAAEAATLLQERLVAVPDSERSPMLLQLWGNALASLGRDEEAIATLRAAASGFDPQREAAARGRCAEDLARVLLDTGEAGAAAAVCRRALDEAGSDAEPRARARLALVAAQAERQAGRHATAEETCRQVLEWLKPLGRTLELAQTYSQLGTNAVHRREFAQAARYHRRAVTLHAELGDWLGLKNAYNNLGSALMRAGHQQEALVALRDSLDLKRRLGDRTGEGATLNNLGNVHERLGEYRRAMECYRHGVAIYSRLGRPRELAILYANMAEVRWRLGKLGRALALLERAGRHAESMPGAYIGLVVAHNAGVVHLDGLSPGRALEVLDDAGPRAAAAGLNALAVQVEAVRCAALAAAGRHHEAEALELRVATESDRESRPEAIGEVLVWLAEAAASRGAHALARARAVKAAALARDCAQPYTAARALRIAGGAAAGLGDWDVADHELERAIEQCGTWGYRQELARCYKLRGRVHWEIGLRSRAQAEFERCIETLAALDLRTELGLACLELARLLPAGEA